MAVRSSLAHSDARRDPVLDPSLPHAAHQHDHQGQHSRITTLTEWETRAGPKHRSQWRDGRSAKESARAWLSVGAPELPDEIARLLATSAAFGPMLAWQAEPEARIRFDDLGGEPANLDLLLVGEDKAGALMIGVEAEASGSVWCRDPRYAGLRAGATPEEPRIERHPPS